MSYYRASTPSSILRKKSSRLSSHPGSDDSQSTTDYQFLQHDVLRGANERRPRPVVRPSPSATAAMRSNLHESRQEGRKDTGEARLVIAIDFGTTFTGKEVPYGRYWTDLS